MSEIVGSHTGVPEDSSLLGFCSVSSGKALLDTEDEGTTSFKSLSLFTIRHGAISQ